MTTPPPLAVGMPVYNGEPFLEETLESILQQSFTDFELIITDNASTDRTEAICRSVAAADGRVRYHRHRENLGAAVNYSSCFEQSSAPLFKWAAHDDPCGQGLFAAMIDALAAHPHAVMAYSRAVTIDAEGRVLKEWRPRPALASADMRDRTADILGHQETFPVWGVIRREVLAATGLLGSFIEHDRPLLYQLALHGPLIEIDEPLFFDREHAGRSVRAYDHTDPHVAATWYDTRFATGTFFPVWRLFGEHLRSLHRSPVPSYRSGPHLVDLARYAHRRRTGLTKDLIVAGANLPWVGPTVADVAAKRNRRVWERRADRVIETLATLPLNCGVALVDEGVLCRDSLETLRVHEVPSQDGAWSGLPASSAEAIAAVGRARRAGASHLAILETSAWWLDHYEEFARHVETVTMVVLRTDDVTIRAFIGPEEVAP